MCIRENLKIKNSTDSFLQLWLPRFHLVNRMQRLCHMLMAHTAKEEFYILHHCECVDALKRTHTSYDSDTLASTHLYEAELPPAESIADRRERAYSQQDKQAKSQNPHSIVRVRAPGHGGVKLCRSVLLDLKVTVNKAKRCVQNPKSSECMVIYCINKQVFLMQTQSFELISHTCYLAMWLSYLWNGTVSNPESHIISVQTKVTQLKTI